MKKKCQQKGEIIATRNYSNKIYFVLGGGEKEPYWALKQYISYWSTRKHWQLLPAGNRFTENHKQATLWYKNQSLEESIIKKYSKEFSKDCRNWKRGPLCTINAGGKTAVQSFGSKIDPVSTSELTGCRLQELPRLDLHSSIQSDACHCQFPGCCHCFHLFESILFKLLHSSTCIKIHFHRKIGQLFVSLFHTLQFYRETFYFVCRHSLTHVQTMAGK